MKKVQFFNIVDCFILPARAETLTDYRHQSDADTDRSDTVQVLLLPVIACAAMATVPSVDTVD